MKKYDFERQLIEELQETQEKYEIAIDEYDILMNFVMHHNLTKMLDSYIYEQIQNCNDEHLMGCYMRLITHEPEGNSEKESIVTEQVRNPKPFFFVNGQPVDFTKIFSDSSKQ